MKTHTRGFVRTGLLAGAFLAMGATAVSATPAAPDKGTGCVVVDANGALYFDAACLAHDVLKLDADGNVAFYEYHDVGQLPAGAALPSSAVRSTYEQCIHIGLVVACGTVDETITPAGAYRPSFTYR